MKKRVAACHGVNVHLYKNITICNDVQASQIVHPVQTCCPHRRSTSPSWFRPAVLTDGPPPPPPRFRPAVLIGDCDQFCLPARFLSCCMSLYVLFCLLCVCVWDGVSQRRHVRSLNIDYYCYPTLLSVKYHFLLHPVGFPPSFIELFCLIFR